VILLSGGNCIEMEVFHFLFLLDSLGERFNLLLVHFVASNFRESAKARLSTEDLRKISFNIKEANK